MKEYSDMNCDSYMTEYVEVILSTGTYYLYKI